MLLIETPNQPPHMHDPRSSSKLSELEEGAANGCRFVTRDELNEKGSAIIGQIMRYRNENVIERFLADNPATTREEAEAAWVGLLQFLTICVLNRGNHTPSKIVDEMWHAFILHMRDYESFCTEHLRQMIYHDPAHDDSAFKFYAVARNCVIALFGSADPLAWPREHVRYTRCISCDAPSDFLFEDCLRTVQH